MKSMVIVLVSLFFVTCQKESKSNLFTNLELLLRIREKNKPTVYAVTVTGTARLGGTIKGAKVELHTIPTTGVDAGKCNGVAGTPLSDPVTTEPGDSAKNDGGNFKIIFPKTSDKIACLIVTPTPTSTMYSPLNNKLIRWRPNIQNGVESVRVASIISLPEPTLQKHSSKSANVNPLTNIGAGAFSAGIRQRSRVSRNLFKRIKGILTRKEPIFANTISDSDLLSEMEKQNNKVGEQFFKNSKVKVDPSEFNFDADPNLNKQLSAILGGMDKAVSDAAKKKGVDPAEAGGDLFDSYIDGLTNDFAGDGKLDGKGIVNEDGEPETLDPNDEFYADFLNPAAAIAADMLEYIQAEIAEGGDDEWDTGDLSDPSLTGGDICTAGYDATGNCIGSFAGANEIPEGFPSPGDFGQITTVSNTDGTLTLNWTAATDPETPASSLQYQVYYATEPDLLDVEFIQAFGTPLNEFTASISSFQVTTLTSGYYFFNVLVKDSEGNISSYTMEQGLYVGDGSGVVGVGGQAGYSDLCSNVIPIYFTGQVGTNNQLFWNAFDCNDILILDSTGTVVLGTATVDETQTNPITITSNSSGASLTGTLSNNIMTLTDGTNSQSITLGIIPSGVGSGTLTVSGTLTGLVLGETLVLQNNGGDDLTINADGFFTFQTAMNAGDFYSVTILTQPSSSSCSVTNDIGTISADVTDVVVSCFIAPPPPTLTVSGNLSGMIPSNTIVLQNNGADDLVLTSDGSFTFITPLTLGDTYTVTILNQPVNHTCSVTNDTGLISANVTNVSVSCTFNSGGLDETFGGGNGYVVYTGGIASVGFDMVFDSTEQIYVTGGYVPFTDMDFALWRYLDDGTLDTSFGASGLETVAVSTTMEEGRGITIDPSDNVYLSAYGNGTFDLEIYKYDPVTEVFSSVVSDSGRAPTYRSILYDSGNLYIAATCIVPGSCLNATSSNDISLIKRDIAGITSYTYDQDGFYTGTDIANEYAGNGIAMLGSDILISATGENGSAQLGTGLMRLDTSGGLVGGFGSSGVATMSILNQEKVNSFAVDLSNSIYVLTSGHTGSGTPPRLVKLNSSGGVDTSFATSGVYSFLATDRAEDIAIDASGRVIVVGATAPQSPSDLKIWRFNSNGTLDPSFNSVGFTTHAVYVAEAASAVKIDSNGKILVLGAVGDGTANDSQMAMWRFNP